MTPKNIVVNTVSTIQVSEWLSIKIIVKMKYIARFSILDLFKNLTRKTNDKYPIISANQFA
jgi:hypothetical protein